MKRRVQKYHRHRKALQHSRLAQLMPVAVQGPAAGTRRDCHVF
jgi:hypothetical protein